ncbi:hypothetical protein LOK49_LG06G01775 [Camellia lanceoleosa]|uniref:Uncharacterized protein n=1 Tax=Camellia lanceoleosa TaxID=1840588 RepID=A0ACC0HCE8_9ERIC|nr:hypothetical protein LOK49_LG06G01775 [Camellia lanceoleosa]
MASAAARSFFRSTPVRNAAAKLASEAKAARSPFRPSTPKPLSQRIFRCPVEMSACVDSMQPFHTATASALMTSMLSISRHSCGWLPEAEMFDLIGPYLLTCWLVQYLFGSIVRYLAKLHRILLDVLFQRLSFVAWEGGVAGHVGMEIRENGSRAGASLEIIFL